MNYKTLFFVVFALLIVQSFTAQAASIARPSVAGYGGGMYKTSTPSIAANGSSYNISGVTNIAGTAINLAGAIPLAANAAEYALAAMKGNPYALIGTLALTYLIANGYDLSPDNTGFVKSGYSSYTSTLDQSISGSSVSDYCSKVPSSITGGHSLIQASGTIYCAWADNPSVMYSNNPVLQSGSVATVPMTDDNWKSLPNPLPAIAPELPNAPYLPNGVPVDPPVFQPADIPTASPYNEPNGATVQPRATITPNPADAGTVQIQTYDMPVTSSHPETT
jgi:hypothetical protein